MRVSDLFKSPEQWKRWTLADLQAGRIPPDDLAKLVAEERRLRRRRRDA